MELDQTTICLDLFCLIMDIGPQEQEPDLFELMLWQQEHMPEPVGTLASYWQEVRDSYPRIPQPNVYHWEGRRCEYIQFKLNRQNTVGLLVAPGSQVRLEAQYRTSWSYSRTAVARESTIQFYLGTPGLFCLGVVEWGIRNTFVTGILNNLFRVPNVPGEYPICHRMSQRQLYQPSIYHNPRILRNEHIVARVVVIPTVWNDKLAKLISHDKLRVLQVLLLMAQRDQTGQPRYPETHWHRLPVDLITKIFMQYLLFDLFRTGIPMRDCKDISPAEFLENPFVYLPPISDNQTSDAEDEEVNDDSESERADSAPMLWQEEHFQGTSGPISAYWERINATYPLITKPNVYLWAGRRCAYTNFKLNNHVTDGLLVAPGSRVRIRADFYAYWNRNAGDYCPGCIVQFYVGIPGVCCIGVVEYGVNDHSGHVDSFIQMPNVPGEYPICHRHSLQYSYTPVIYHNSRIDEHEHFVGRIVCIPPVWNDKLVKLLPTEKLRVLKVLLLMRLNDKRGQPRHPETHWHRLPIELVTTIFMQYLLHDLYTSGIPMRVVRPRTSLRGSFCRNM